MSATSLDIFDRTMQTTNIWLKEISAEIGPDRHLAWKVLSTVLHKLRDRLPFEVSVHLGSQLPLLVRGVYYDQYRPSDAPDKTRHADEFIEDVAKWLSDVRPVDPRLAVITVFGVLDRHIDPGQVAKVKGTLPHEIRALWDEAAQQLMEPAGA
ncbi:MAG TPA: DUF2267 domain-containing protein [Sphingomicrobium sp.]|nr:DUF2267 domain-containing protein [Sphingomicrobium sp.]